MDERQERIGKNEALFRDVNERIGAVTDSAEAEFLCECGQATCTSPIRMSLSDYEDVRAHANRFAILPGHEIPDVETVVAEGDGFVVVEKHRGESTRVAEARDPRS